MSIYYQLNLCMLTKGLGLPPLAIHPHRMADGVFRENDKIRKVKTLKGDYAECYYCCEARSRFVDRQTQALDLVQ